MHAGELTTHNNAEQNDARYSPEHTEAVLTKTVEQWLTSTETPSDNLNIHEDLDVMWIKDTPSLAQLVDKLSHCTRVALDTEFIKRNTYYPYLALVQINTGEAIYLVDAPRLDLTEFWQQLAALPIIIWHACGEDLNIFYQLSELPALTNVFDTQIAMGFLTGKLQVGYQNSLKEMLSKDIDKEQSQSNWLQRPLTYEQEIYAANDVRYLLPLYETIVLKLIEKSMLLQCWEDCQLYAHDIHDNYYLEDKKQYLSFVSYRHDGLQREFLRDIFYWRERLAQALNKPRNYILKKQGIKDLVDTMPMTLRDLRYKTTLHRSVIDSYGNEILKIVKKAREADEANFPPPVMSSYHSKEKCVQKLVTRKTTEYQQKTGIPKNLLIKKKWLDSVYTIVALDESVESLPRALQGWRKAWVVNELIPALTPLRQELRYGMRIDRREF